MEELGLPLCQHEPNPIPGKKNPVSFSILRQIIRSPLSALLIYLDLADVTPSLYVYGSGTNTFRLFVLLLKRFIVSFALIKQTKLTELLSPWVCTINFDSQILMYRLLKRVYL